MKQWLPLIGLTFSAFVFNTSEFMPIGLLSDIAASFNKTEAGAGVLISVYAWFVAFLSLPLMLAFSKVELRRLLFIVIGVFIVSHVLSGLATSFPLLMMSRIGVACSHSIFWSIVSPMAVRIVPEKHRSLALGMVVTGTSIAMIVGLPLGRVIGLYIGWRMTFYCIAIVAAAILAYLAVVLPKLPASENSFSFRNLPSLFKNRALLGIFIMALVMPTAHYTGYSYIEPFMFKVAHLDNDLITIALTLFGIAGILGSVLFSRYFDRYPRKFTNIVTAGVAVSLLLMHPASFNQYTVIALCILWGAVITAFNVVFQAEIIGQTSMETTSIAMSIFSGTYNLGIGLGTTVGGMVCTYVAIDYIGYFGGVLAIVAALYCGKRLLILLKMQ